MKKIYLTALLCTTLALGFLAPLSACRQDGAKREESSAPVPPAQTDDPWEAHENGQPQEPEENLREPETSQPQEPEADRREPETSQPQEPEEDPREPETSQPQKPEEDPREPETSQPQKSEANPREPEHEKTQPGTSEESPKKAQTARYIRILTDGLNVRKEPGVGSSRLGQVQKGELLALTDRRGDWFETYFRGQRAYLSADPRYSREIQLEIHDERTEKIIFEGLKLLGTPYVYGAQRYHDGTGKLLTGFQDSAFDCSSLMQYIFYKGAGIKLLLTTRTQIAQGKRVANEEIARGDLLFFTNDSRANRTGIERVGHVALYLGENYILHTASDYAKIEQISPKRQNYFLEARRMV